MCTISRHVQNLWRGDLSSLDRKAIPYQPTSVCQFYHGDILGLLRSPAG